MNCFLIKNVNSGVIENFCSWFLNTKFGKAIELNLIKDNRYLYIVNGVINTLVITIFATIFGSILGLIVALIRTTYENTKKLRILNAFCKAYVAIIRGTPVVVQLMILFFCIFTMRDISPIFVAIVGFALNTTAYVSEVFRSGLMSIEKGQMEAGRSLGFNYIETMRYIIIPQAFKMMLPALGNEFVVLIKETSVAGYVAVQDLTKGGDIIRSRTYDAWTPLIIVAGLYFIMTSIFSHFVQKLERNLRKNER